MTHVKKVAAPQLCQESIPEFPGKFPNKKDIQRYIELAAEKSLLESQVRAIDKEMNILKSDLLAYARHYNGNANRCGYTLTAKEHGKHPAWKEEFEKRLGAKAVAEVLEYTQPSFRLVVTQTT